MKTFAEFQESVASLALKGGVKFLPKIPGALKAITAGTLTGLSMLQARKYRTRNNKNVSNKPKRKISDREKKIFDSQKDYTMQKGSDEHTTKGLIKRGDKFTKQTTRGTSKNSDAGYTTTPEPTIEKPPTFTGRVDPTKGAPTPKRTTFKKQTKLTPENQFEDAAPTNSMGGGAIAGSVEAGDNPPVKKKKRYIYGGTGSRKMWMNNK